MDNNQVTPEEQAAEQAALQQVKEEDVRAKVIEEFGFDETNDADKISKLVAKELEHNKKLSSAIGQKIKYREAAKKPAADAKTQTPPATEAKKEVNISTADIIALNRANVHEDDIADVEEYAGYKKISITEALKSPLLKATLAEKAEQRSTAAATSTSTSRRSTTTPSGDDLVAKAQAGDFAESDEDIEKLMAARAPKPKSRQ